MLLNELRVSENLFGPLNIVITYVQIITLLELKEIVKSCLVEMHLLCTYCAIPNCYICQLCVNRVVFNKK